jgi:Baseplate J-like protein
VSTTIYLDVDDEITSAAVRIRDANAGPVALVLPVGSRIATSRINFRLLAREAQGSGHRLAIVASDGAARGLATSAGLATFGSVGEFEASLESGAATAGGPGPLDSFRPGADDAPTTVVPTAGMVAGGLGAGRDFDGPATRPVPYDSRDGVPVTLSRRSLFDRTGLIVFAAVLVVLLVGGIVGAFFLLPSAVITLMPRTQAIGPLALEVVADPSATKTDATTLVVPARTLTFPIEATDTFPATGKRIVEAKAKGAVTFQNCDTGRSIAIPKGSIVSTDAGITFSTTAAVTVPRASVLPAFACKAASVSVLATKAGPAGNVIAGSITHIPPGYDPVVLSVTNPQPTTGGTHQEFPKILQSDVDAALKSLRKKMSDALAADVKAAPAANPGLTVFAETASLTGPAPAPTVDPATLVGKEVATFDLGLTGAGSVVAVDPGPVKEVGTAVTATHVTTGYQLIGGSMKVEVGQPTVQGQLVTFPVTAQALEVRTVDLNALLAKIKGKTLPVARALLSPYGSVRLDVWPDWVTTVPTMDSRLTFRISAAQASAAPGSSASPSGSSAQSSAPSTSP